MASQGKGGGGRGEGVELKRGVVTVAGAYAARRVEVAILASAAIPSDAVPGSAQALALAHTPTVSASGSALVVHRPRFHKFKRAHQVLPRALRRRAMSHNPFRLPRRLRRSAIQQMLANAPTTAGIAPDLAQIRATQAALTAKRKKSHPPRPVRRALLRRSLLFRPAPPLLVPSNGQPKLAEGVERVRLESHVWHAKRFRMGPTPALPSPEQSAQAPTTQFIVALAPANKTRRQNHRRGQGGTGAFVWEASAVSRVGLAYRLAPTPSSSPSPAPAANSTSSSFWEAVARSMTRIGLRSAAEAVASRVAGWDCRPYLHDLLHPSDRPTQPIGPVTVLCHVPKSHPGGEEGGAVDFFVWASPAVLAQTLATLQAFAQALPTSEPLLHLQVSRGVGEWNRFEVWGPGAGRVVAEVLFAHDPRGDPPSTSPDSLSRPTPTRDLIVKLLTEERGREDFGVFGVRVADPRVSLRRLRAAVTARARLPPKPYPTSATQLGGSHPYGGAGLDAMVGAFASVGGAATGGESGPVLRPKFARLRAQTHDLDLWDSRWCQTAATSPVERLSDLELAAVFSRPEIFSPPAGASPAQILASTAHYLASVQGAEEAKVAVLVHRTAEGWAVICPPKWAQPFLFGFVASGAQIVSMSERQEMDWERACVAHVRPPHVDLPLGVAWPWSRLELDWPDTEAYRMHSVAEERELQAKWERTPAGKRVNFAALLPRHFPTRPRTASTHSTLPEVRDDGGRVFRSDWGALTGGSPPVVLRSESSLRLLPSPLLDGAYLVPVWLKIAKGTTPTANGRIYALPEESWAEFERAFGNAPPSGADLLVCGKTYAGIRMVGLVTSGQLCLRLGHCVALGFCSLAALLPHWPRHSPKISLLLRNVTSQFFHTAEAILPSYVESWLRTR